MQLAKVLGTQVYELLKPDDVFPDKAAEIIAKYSDKVRDAIERVEKSFAENQKK